MNAITAPELSAALAAQQARPTTPTNRNVLSKEPFTLDMDGVTEFFAEQAGKVGTPMTPKEMERWDEQTLAAWSGLQ